jgi:hypothetical protein
LNSNSAGAVVRLHGLPFVLSRSMFLICWPHIPWIRISSNICVGLY